MSWVDKGKEYYNKNVLDLLDKNNIEIYSTENEEKTSLCERWNRTFKEKCTRDLPYKITLSTLTFY